MREAPRLQCESRDHIARRARITRRCAWYALRAAGGDAQAALARMRSGPAVDLEPPLSHCDTWVDWYFVSRLACLEPPSAWGVLRWYARVGPPWCGGPVLAGLAGVLWGRRHATRWVAWRCLAWGVLVDACAIAAIAAIAAAVKLVGAL